MNTSHINLQNKVYGALVTGLAVVGLMMNSTAARAADDRPGYDAASQQVSYSDLNLATSDGVKRLYDRIVSASKAVCDSRSRSLEISIHDRLCTQMSIARAVRAVDLPQLTAFAAARHGQPVSPVAEVARR
jgi:UrcA family protein